MLTTKKDMAEVPLLLTNYPNLVFKVFFKCKTNSSQEIAYSNKLTTSHLNKTFFER